MIEITPKNIEANFTPILDPNMVPITDGSIVALGGSELSKAAAGAGGWRANINYEAGTKVIKSADTERTGTATTYTKIKDIQVTKAGTVTVDFDLKKIGADLSAYTEVDPNNRLAETATRITFTGITIDETAYVYKDYTANYFAGDFTHYVDFRVDATPTTDFQCAVWLMSNDLNDYANLDVGNKSHLRVTYYKWDVDSGRLYLTERDTSTPYSDYYYGIIPDTTYYLKIVRDEAVGTYGTIYCYIYPTVADRIADTNRIDRLEIALHTSKKNYQYLMGFCSEDENALGRTGSGYVENLTAPSCMARIYVNDAAIGTEREATTAYVTHSEDIAVKAADAVQLYYKSNDLDTAYVRYFRVKANAYETSYQTLD